MDTSQVPATSVVGTGVIKSGYVVDLIPGAVAGPLDCNGVGTFTDYTGDRGSAERVDRFARLQHGSGRHDLLRPGGRRRRHDARFNSSLDVLRKGMPTSGIPFLLAGPHPHSLRLDSLRSLADGRRRFFVMR